MRHSISRLGFMVCGCLVVGLASSIASRSTRAAEPAAPVEKEQGNGDEAADVLGKLPKDFVVHAVGTYRAKGDVGLPDLELDDSGHQVGQAEVVVNIPDKPVVLVLTAYDPVVWRVGRTERTQIAGVVVSGYHGQALIGVERQTPRALSTYEVKNGPFRYFYAYKASPELLAMNDAVKQLVGREIERFVNEPNGGAFYVGDRPGADEKVIHSDDLKAADYAVKRPPPLPGKPAAPKMAGAKGLDQLVAEGKLRPATQADIEAWVDKASEPYKRFNPNLRVETHMRPERTYVVLAPVVLPDGLAGAHSRHFIVPNGVPLPSGPEGHNTFCLMDGTEVSPFTRGKARLKAARERAQQLHGNPVF